MVPTQATERHLTRIVELEAHVMKLERARRLSEVALASHCRRHRRPPLRPAPEDGNPGLTPVPDSGSGSGSGSGSDQKGGIEKDTELLAEFERHQCDYSHLD